MQLIKSSSAKGANYSYPLVGPALDNALVAWIRLNKADAIKDSEPSIELYLSILQEAFLTLFDKEGALVQTADITPLGWDAVETMRCLKDRRLF